MSTDLVVSWSYIILTHPLPPTVKVLQTAIVVQNNMIVTLCCAILEHVIVEFITYLLERLAIWMLTVNLVIVNQPSVHWAWVLDGS